MDDVNGVKGKRGYDNTRRAEQARLTRRRVIEIARGLFLEQGYSGTTLAQIASAAGVSVETVQKTFGTKAQLAKAVYDVTLIGDDEPVPLRDRPEIAAMIAETDPRRRLALYAALGRTLLARLGPLLNMVLPGAAAGEADLVDLVATIRTESMLGASGQVARLAADGDLRPGLSEDRACELLWWLIQPEQYQLLVGVRGWSLDRFQEWLATTSADLLIGKADVQPV
jgi:AcrR family transcriptional regulator